jgi:RimJ/RimL family protein N-acetyltransferase
LGFHLRPRYWGQGLAPEAARAVIHYAFETIGAKGLSAGHHPQNTTSKKLIEKLGFQYTHDEFYAPLQMHLPYYLLRPQR